MMGARNGRAAVCRVEGRDGRAGAAARTGRRRRWYDGAVELQEKRVAMVNDAPFFNASSLFLRQSVGD